jgi:hypothetical protein
MDYSATDAFGVRLFHRDMREKRLNRQDAKDAKKFNLLKTKSLAWLALLRLHHFTAAFGGS